MVIFHIFAANFSDMYHYCFNFNFRLLKRATVLKHTVFVFLLFAGSVVYSQNTAIDFNNQREGSAPTDFTQAASSAAQTMDWSVVNDNGKKVVAQRAKNSGENFNILVMDNANFKDGVIKTSIKAVAGNEDQGGGLVWRYIDNNNYYIARFNPLEDNLRFYKVVKGVRTQLVSADYKVKSGEWFDMEIAVNENKITCSLNGDKLIETSDDTFPNSGKVGLWTKADAQTYFSHLSISPLK